MSEIQLTPEIKASVKAQLSQSFLDACSHSGSRETLAELVYNTAITNPKVLKAQALLEEDLKILGTILTELGTQVNLGGAWIPFGADKAATLAAVVQIDSTIEYYVGGTTLKVGSGSKLASQCALWLSV
jgi:hypothetical protein